MSYASLAACDFQNPAAAAAAPSTPASILAAAQQSAAQKIGAVQAHAKAVQQQQAYKQGIDALTPSWSKLPMGPYPPASDTSGFPPSGDPSLFINKAGVTAAALAEPGRITANNLAQAQARTPHLSPLFWVGLVILGAGIYVARNS